MPSAKSRSKPKPATESRRTRLLRATKAARNAKQQNAANMTSNDIVNQTFQPCESVEIKEHKEPGPRTNSAVNMELKSEQVTPFVNVDVAEMKKETNKPLKRKGYSSIQAHGHSNKTCLL